MPDPHLPEFTYSIPWSFVENAMSYDIPSQLTTSDKAKLFIVGREDSIVDPAIVYA
jgi:hypothetical protein